MSIAFFLILAVGLGAVLWRLAGIDLKTRRLPDAYTLPLVVAGLIINGIVSDGLPADAVWGAVVGYAVFWGLGTAFFARTGREGLGLGDAKLMAAAGAWVGLGHLPAVLLVAAGSALAHAWGQRLRTSDQIAFGPWLSAAFWLVWIVQFAQLADIMTF